MRLTFTLALLTMLSLGCTPVVYSGGGGYGYAPPHYAPRSLPYYGASYGYGGGYGYAPPYYAPRPAAYYGASYGVHVHAGAAGAGHRGQQPCTPRYARPMR